MAIRETYVPISDATPVVLVDPATGNYYTLVAVPGGYTINRVNGVPVSNALPVVLVDPTGGSGGFYKATGGGTGSGFAEVFVVGLAANATSEDIVFSATATNPIPIILATSWATNTYFSNLSTSGFRVNFSVETPDANQYLIAAYVEA